MTELKEAVIKAYDARIQSQDSLIKECQADIKDCNSCIEEAQNKKKELGAECTNILKLIDENKLSNRPHFTLTPEESITLSKEDCERANEWVVQHELTHHTETFLGLQKNSRFRGVTPVAKYELRKGWTGLGPWVSLVCTACKEKDVKMEECEFDIVEIGY